MTLVSAHCSMRRPFITLPFVVDVYHVSAGCPLARPFSRSFVSLSYVTSRKAWSEVYNLH